MSKQESTGSFSTRKSLFRTTHRTNHYLLHKSWQRKRDSNLSKFPSPNVYRLRKHSYTNTLKCGLNPAAHYPPSEVTVKTLISQPAIPHTSTTLTYDTNGKERISANIHVNPLFSGGNIKKTNSKVLKNFPAKPGTLNTGLLPKTVANEIISIKILDSENIASTGITSSYIVPNTGSELFSNRASNAKTNLDYIGISSKDKDSNDNRPSIHINPSVLVGNRENSNNDIKHSNAMQTYIYKTLQAGTSTKSHLSISAHPIVIHDKGFVYSNSAELGRLIPRNPTAQTSKGSVNQSSTTKSSVHVNPKTYARLKSEVRKEKPIQQELTSSKTKSTSGLLNRSLVSISRTKLVRRGLLRTRKPSFRKSLQSLAQISFDTTKGKHVLSGSRTPPSAVVKVAKSVCSKYKFIRKSSSSTSLPNSNLKSSFVHSTYKLDRRSQKTPRPSKKVKKYSITYDNLKHNYVNNIQRILGNKRSLSSRNYMFNSKVWKKPGSLVPKKSITNRKLLRIGDNPNIKTKRNTSSSHKTLVRLGGVLYKTSRMKLTRTRTGRRKSLGHKENKQKYVRKSVNQNHILHVRGDSFLMDHTGMTLKRIDSNKPEQSRPVKRIDICGVTFIQKSKNVLIRTNTHQARNVLSQAKNKSIAVLTTRMRKNNTHCRFYRRLGKCIGKEKGRCPCIHDPKYITICRKLLKGECSGDGCLLSHETIPEKMPICKFFMLGSCSRDACAYLHVQSDPKAPICLSFLQGYCPGGLNCNKRHLYVCPYFDKNGKCPKSKYCPYPHKLRENLTLNIDHMSRCANDVPEINNHVGEPKADEFRYFNYNKDHQIRNTDTQSENESDVQVNHKRDDTLPLNNSGSISNKFVEDGEALINPSVRDIIVKRHNLFNEVFSLIDSNSAQVNSPSYVEESLTIPNEPTLATNTHEIMMLQIAFIDRLFKHTTGRSDFMPLDDNERKKIKSSLKNAHNYSKQIQMFVLQGGENPHLGSETSNFNKKNVKTMSLGGNNEVVTCEWIEQIIKQCDIVHLELGKANLNKTGNNKDSNPLVLSVLQLTDHISRSLQDLVNTLKNSGTSLHKDNSNVTSNLVKLLQNLHNVLKARDDKESCNLSIQDNTTETVCDSTDSGLESKTEANTCHLEQQKRVKCLERRRKVGNVPYYIPLN